MSFLQRPHVATPLSPAGGRDAGCPPAGGRWAWRPGRRPACAAAGCRRQRWAEAAGAELGGPSWGSPAAGRGSETAPRPGGLASGHAQSTPLHTHTGRSIRYRFTLKLNATLQTMAMGTTNSPVKDVPPLHSLTDYLSDDYSETVGC